MSISSALASAVSGLNVTARNADVISSNLANVLTPGYVRRQLEINDLGRLTGVGVTGITRQVDEGIVADRRQADSALAFVETQAKFLAGIDLLIGTPDSPSSLAARLSTFEAGLISASANPENPASLQEAIGRAADLTRALNAASDGIQKQRTDADSAITRTVDDVNTLLRNIRQLNVDILKHGPADGYAATLRDQRQDLVDQLSRLVPVRQVPREGGSIALFTPGGAILLDGTAAELGFAGSNLVAPHMTLQNGLLSGLSINGINVAPSGASSPIDSGRLAALFTVRDDLAVDAQTQLDAIARNLVERFQQVGLDPTLASGAPGLLTDAGSAFDPANERGLSARITLNAGLDPAQGGAIWRLRDGLGALTPGAEGNGVLITRLSDALSAPRAMTSGDLGPTARSASGHIASFTSRLAQDRLATDRSVSFASTRQTELASQELRNGVDSDAEMQRLLLVEQAYAANARMIQALDEMMQNILGI